MTTTREAAPAMLDRVRRWFSPDRDAALKTSLEELKRRTAVPVFWLFGKTQSGKTSLIRYLTGAADAEIGEGFRPCTPTSRQYQYPAAETPLLTFLDTRGLDEPTYNPAEDLAKFNHGTHLIVVTVKALDHAQENILHHLGTLRKALPTRPVLLVLTCLHEANPTQQHPPYPYPADLKTATLGTDDLSRSLAEQLRRFGPLVDRAVAIDLTKPEEGYAEPNFGGEVLKQALHEMLPAAYRQTLLTLDAGRELDDVHRKAALPYIAGYTALATAAGAVPVPFLDLVLLPGIQAKLVHDLARVYRQPLNAKRFLELASAIGIGMLARQGIRELAKLIPVVGSVAAATLAGASTFALGQAFCRYLALVNQGQVPSAAELKQFYGEELSRAEKLWAAKK